MRGRKKLILLVGAIIVIVAVAGVAYYLTLPKVHTISIGLLADFSGPLTTYGFDIRDSVLLAAEDVNAWFKERGLPYEVKVYPEDTRVDPAVALSKTELLYGKGVRLIIGPMGSGEVANILAYVTGNKIVIISPSSTAVPKLLGVTSPEEKKYLFRFVPTDVFQTKAIAKEAEALGIKAVCIVYIGNAWGKGLRDYGIPEFEKLGIKVKVDVEYPDPPPPDFMPYIATLRDAVESLKAEGYSLKEIAVVAFSYEEVATILAQIPEGSPLLDVVWIGCDGTAKSGKVIEDVPERASKVKLYSTLFESVGPAYEDFVKRYREKYKKDPYQYGLNAYDALYVMALSYVEVFEELKKYDPDAMVEKIRAVTEKYSRGEYGFWPVSGPITLDEWNDRAGGDYAIYAVVNGEWKKVGTFKYEAGKVEFIG